MTLRALSSYRIVRWSVSGRLMNAGFLEQDAALMLILHAHRDSIFKSAHIGSYEESRSVLKWCQDSPLAQPEIVSHGHFGRLINGFS